MPKSCISLAILSAQACNEHDLTLDKKKQKHHLDGHSSYVEAKGKQAFLALEPLEANSEFTLGDGEGVTQVQLTVHVRVGEGHHIPEV